MEWWQVFNKVQTYGIKIRNVKGFLLRADKEGFYSDAGLCEILRIEIISDGFVPWDKEKTDDQRRSGRSNQLPAASGGVGIIFVGNKKDTFRRGFWRAKDLS